MMPGCSVRLKCIDKRYTFIHSYRLRGSHNGAIPAVIWALLWRSDGTPVHWPIGQIEQLDPDESIEVMPIASAKGK